MDGSRRIRKLRWCCRRGMKELDILLGTFLNAQGPAIAQGAWPELEALLKTEDDLLWAWVQDPSSAQVATFRPLLRQIRRVGN
ncbi:MAG: succinate dehydrogenase assembly factor 2 [Xanthomonadales bacterium]|nr:succinate dehydrogenase assembly factor 2 [Xanthomonadales bacterium]